MSKYISKEIQTHFNSPYNSSKQKSKFHSIFNSKASTHAASSSATKSCLKYQPLNTISTFDNYKSNKQKKLAFNTLSTSCLSSKDKSKFNKSLEKRITKKNSKYPFLKSRKLKYLNQDDIDNVLTFKTTETPQMKIEPLNPIYTAINTMSNIKNKKDEFKPIIGKIENKELSKILLANLSRDKSLMNNCDKKEGGFAPKKYSMTARFLLKLQDPQDCIEEHIVQNVHAEDKYTKFKLLLSRQRDKNLKMLNEVKEAAVVNDNLLKVYMIKLLRNRIKSEKMSKRMIYK